MFALLVNEGDPMLSTLCVVAPGPQVQVTVCPTAMVSCAGLLVPLCALLKKMSPTVTAPTAPPPPPPPLFPPLSAVVPVLSLEHPMAAAAMAASSQVRDLLMTPPSMARRLVRATPLAHLICC